MAGLAPKKMIKSESEKLTKKGDKIPYGFIESRLGEIKAHPAVGVLKDCEANIRATLKILLIGAEVKRSAEKPKGLTRMIASRKEKTG